MFSTVPAPEPDSSSCRGKLKEHTEGKLEKKGKKEEKNSGEKQSRVGFSKRSYLGSKMHSFPPLFLFSVCARWADPSERALINSDFTVPVGVGEWGKKGGFKERLAASQ